MNFDEYDHIAASLPDSLPDPLAGLCHEAVEAATLSILMNFPAAFDDLADRLKPEHFSAPTTGRSTPSWRARWPQARDVTW